MSFLNDVKLPGQQQTTSTDKKKPVASSPTSFLSSVKMPTPQSQKIAQYKTEQLQYDQAVKDTSNLWKGTLKAAGDMLYNAVGGLLLPGATPEELRNKTLMKDTILGIPKAILDTGIEAITHPIDTAQSMVGGAARGISDEITGIITNLFVPKQDQEATANQIKETLDKYLGATPDTNIAKGFETGGRAAPYIAAGAALGEAGAALGGRVGGALGEETGTIGRTAWNLGGMQSGAKIGGTLGSATGFVTVGQMSLPTDSTLEQRAERATQDLVALGLFEIGGKAFEATKEYIKTGLKEKVISEITPPPPSDTGSPKVKGGFLESILKPGEPQSISTTLPNYVEPKKPEVVGLTKEEIAELKKQHYSDEDITKINQKIQGKTDKTTPVEPPVIYETAPKTSKKTKTEEIPPKVEEPLKTEQTGQSEKINSDAKILEEQFKDDPTFKGTTFSEQSKLYNELLAKDRQMVADIAFGTKSAEGTGLNATTAYKLFGQDTSLTPSEVRRLIDSKKVEGTPGYVLSKAGQELSLSRIGEKINVADVTEDIIKSREKIDTKQGAKPEEVKLTKKGLTDFIKNLECK